MSEKATEKAKVLLQADGRAITSKALSKDGGLVGIWSSRKINVAEAWIPGGNQRLSYIDFEDHGKNFGFYSNYDEKPLQAFRQRNSIIYF